MILLENLLKSLRGNFQMVIYCVKNTSRVVSSSYFATLLSPVSIFINIMSVILCIYGRAEMIKCLTCHLIKSR